MQTVSPQTEPGNGSVRKLPRDRYVDFLRAYSIAFVVFGHWLATVVVWGPGIPISGHNVLEDVPVLKYWTWVNQVMPLFFFISGFSNFMTWRAMERRHKGYGAFVRARVERMIRPLGFFLVAWLVLAGVLDATGFGGETLETVSEYVASPLWFMVAFMLLVIVTPIMVKVHERFGVRAVLAMLVAVALADVFRIGFGLGAFAIVNVAFVWLCVQQVGFFYADGTLLRLPSKLYIGLAVGALALLIALVTVGPYPTSMVSVEDSNLSNMMPPSFALMVMGACHLAIAMLLRPTLSRVLERPRAWFGVVAINLRMMTIFLWHLTAVPIVVAFMMAVNFPQPPPGTLAWWAARAAWMAMLAMVLSPMVLAFGRLEVQRPNTAQIARRQSLAAPSKLLDDVSLTVGALLVALSVMAFTYVGFDEALTVRPETPGGFLASPLLAAAYLLVGLSLMRTPSVRGIVLTGAAAILWVLSAATFGDSLGPLQGGISDHVIGVTAGTVLLAAGLGTHIQRRREATPLRDPSGELQRSAFPARRSSVA
ncbi:MAG: acyltransferase [Actinobacteria bacterium]|nr:acyltransferase [Actinomycetota bacterium]